MKPLTRTFFARPTEQVARDLIGKILVRDFGTHKVSGVITETEAYGHIDDPASHSHRGITERNKAMFGPVGHAYVYFIYGSHFSLNAVARDRQAPAGGVLIRAVVSDQFPADRTNGPGKFAKAFAIDRSLYGTDLTKKGPLYLAQGTIMPFKSTSRIGISKATEKLWRFVAHAG